ncbi:hypothetical protein AVEN_76113-1 [Araneus ventricosus]|uniref:Uncharacterized protein n=1 Tax=Araneus ventricosus TaxID=182803 RepID=A0A4Y2HBS2_ARAVE|nr:hypothetical protein AVEN_76113-1 [Araneus ventricosus]
MVDLEKNEIGQEERNSFLFSQSIGFKVCLLLVETYISKIGMSYPGSPRSSLENVDTPATDSQPSLQKGPCGVSALMDLRKEPSLRVLNLDHKPRHHRLKELLLQV